MVVTPLLIYFCAKAVVLGSGKLLVGGLVGITFLIFSFMMPWPWMASILFVILALGSFFQWRIAQGSYYLRFLVLGWFCFRGLTELLSWKDIKPFWSASYLWLVVFAGVGLAGSVYSVDASTSFLRAGTFVFLMFFIFLYVNQKVAHREDLESLTKAMLFGFGSLVFLGWALLLVGYPGLFSGGRLRLFLGNPNQLGNIAAIMAPLIFWLTFSPNRSRNKMVTYGLFFLSLVSLFWSGSRGGLLAGVVASTFFMYRCHRHIFGKFLFLVLAGALLQYGVSEVFWGEAQVLPLDSNSEFIRSETLSTGSGRLGVWESASNLIKKKPFWGYGFAITDILFFREYFVGLPIEFQGAHVHNGYIEELVNMGYLGSFPLFMILLIAFISALRVTKAQGDLYVAWSAMVLAGLVSSLFESWLTSVGSIFAFPFWTAVAISIKAAASKKLRQNMEEDALCVG